MNGETKKILIDHTDHNIDCDNYTIKSFNDWSKIWILGNVLAKSGQASVHRTKQIGSKYGFTRITKIYHINKEQQTKRILEEYALINKISILRYLDIAYGKNTNEVMITMDTLNYTLSAAVMNKVDDNIHDFACRKSDKNLRYFILEIAGALFQLHRYGYAHLDIKPSNCGFRNYSGENIYVSRNGWKLIDFGIIQNTNNTNSLDGYTGTIGWSSPEMSPYANKDNPNKISTANDIWSFGVLILYIINKGKNIFGLTKEDLTNLNDKKTKHTYFYDTKLFGGNKSGQNELLHKFIEAHLWSLWLGGQIRNINLYQLLAAMLRCDPSERISALEIVKHKYFAKYVRYRPQKNIYQVKRNKTRFVSAQNKKRKWVSLIYDQHIRML